ncbi:MAG: hypothetical protein IIV77_02955, partial [Bacteroidaceae bacterium]|nr:hypothetical protein [Bacteroidaceae bacterium]
MRHKQMLFALLAMLLGFIPPAFAQNVAKIGDKTYKTFAAAVTAATSGQTITLLSDVTESETVVFTKSLNIDG